jgi:hypothetical protein
MGMLVDGCGTFLLARHTPQEVFHKEGYHGRNFLVPYEPHSFAELRLERRLQDFAESDN